MTTEKHHLDRDPRLDILRGIGLLCIILAHVGPPSSIFQLRNFDVPLMVLVSGASFSLSRAQNGKYGQYLFSRFVRLVIPTWIFLAIFFGGTRLWSFIVSCQYPFSMQKIISSFALLNGIGYVWVIRVFFLVALIAPLAKTVLSSNRRTLLWLSLIIIYIVYEFSFSYFPWSNFRWVDVLFKEYIFYVVPYGLLMVIGMTLHQYGPKKQLAGAIILLFIFVCMAKWRHISTGGFVPSQHYKYPPTLYYLSYAVGMSLLLSSMVEMLNIGSLFIGSILAWIGQRTMWIYLWHIFILYVLSWGHIKFNFIIMFPVVSAAAISIVVIQGLILKLILSKFINDGSRKRVTMIFSG